MAACGPENALVEYCLRPSPWMRKLVRNLPPLVDGCVRYRRVRAWASKIDERIVEEFRVG
jgi:hypothetical protein